MFMMGHWNYASKCHRRLIRQKSEVEENSALEDPRLEHQLLNVVDHASLPAEKRPGVARNLDTSLLLKHVLDIASLPGPGFPWLG